MKCATKVTAEIAYRTCSCMCEENVVAFLYISFAIYKFQPAIKLQFSSLPLNICKYFTKEIPETFIVSFK